MQLYVYALTLDLFDGEFQSVIKQIVLCFSSKINLINIIYDARYGRNVRANTQTVREAFTDIHKGRTGANIIFCGCGILSSPRIFSRGTFSFQARTGGTVTILCCRYGADAIVTMCSHNKNSLERMSARSNLNSVHKTATTAATR